MNILTEQTTHLLFILINVPDKNQYKRKHLIKVQLLLDDMVFCVLLVKLKDSRQTALTFLESDHPCEAMSKALAVHISPPPPEALELEMELCETFHDPPRDFCHTNQDANMSCNNVHMTFWRTQWATDFCHMSISCPMLPFVTRNLGVSLAWQLMLVYHGGN